MRVSGDVFLREDDTPAVVHYRLPRTGPTAYVEFHFGDLVIYFHGCDLAVLDALADNLLRAGRDLRSAIGYRECAGCGQMVGRTWPRSVTIGGSADYATTIETETVECCATCAGIDPAEIDEPVGPVAA